MQTASSRTYNLLAKPEFDEDSENLELNKKLEMVKATLDESHIIDKYKDDEFIKLVQAFMKLNETSSNYYGEIWSEKKETARPIFSLK